MTAAHSWTTAPAPRSGDDPTPADPDLDVLLRRAARTAAATGATARCAGDATCRRPASLSVVTDDATWTLCGLHAMTAVFTEPGPVAVVKPGGARTGGHTPADRLCR